MKKKNFSFIFFLGLITLLVLASLSLITTAASSRIFRVQETDFVKIKIDAVDLDKDRVVFTYSAPLNEHGEWQTDLGDAGEYNITITASDGIKETKEEIKLIVDNKNQPPRLKQNSLVVNEKDTVELKTVIEDPDNDPLTFAFPEPFDKNGKWTPGLDDAGSHVVEFTVSDGEFTEELRIGMEVLNTAKPLEIVEVFSEKFSSEGKIDLHEDQTLLYSAEAKAEEEDVIVYEWALDNEIISSGAGEEGAQGEHYFDYDAAGEHTLTLFVNNGRDKLTREWKLSVAKVNRRPEIKFTPLLSVREGELVRLNLPAKDQDGDTLTYSFTAPLNERGEWLTTFEDAGTYEVKVMFTDGEFTEEERVTITVVDVDRAPALTLPAQVDVAEGSVTPVIVTPTDPDGDKVTVTIENLPPGDSLYNEKDKVLLLKPNYETVVRQKNPLSTMLNALRLHRYLKQEKIFPVKIKNCGKDLCSSLTLNVLVHNSNRPPEFAKVHEVTVVETETLALNFLAVDPDGDVVKYRYTAPFDRQGKWTPGYDDEGVQTTSVTASDGITSTTVPISVRVLRKNRLPTINVKDIIIINEGEEFSITATATDPDNDKLTLLLENASSAPGSTPGFSYIDGTFTWKAGFDIVKQRSQGWWNEWLQKFPTLNRQFSDEKETRWVQFVVSDGYVDVVHPVKITVKNVNQAPRILDYLPVEATPSGQPNGEITVRTGQPLLFHVAVKDDDGDPLKQVWRFGLGEEAVMGTDTIRRTFTSPGTKKVTFEAEDGRAAVKKEWVVNVVKEAYVPLPVPAPEPEPKFKVYVVKG